MVERPIVGVGEGALPSTRCWLLRVSADPPKPVVSTKTIDTFARVEFLVDDSTAFFYLVKGDRVAV